MAVAVVGLKEGALVAGNAKPGEAVEDHAGVRLGAALAVGILDPKEEGAAGMTGEEPVEESGPGTADVEVSGGRRREANARRGHWWSTEREGFEPSIGVDPLCRFSKPVPSATRPPLPERWKMAGDHELGKGRVPHHCTAYLRGEATLASRALGSSS